jgi:predicted O-linked N-acetylglucosamine transferase (SPINDLY family)
VKETQTVGSTVLQQTNGAPIGGFISALYGNLVCARAENHYCNSLGSDRRLLAARRCQDDVFGLVAYEESKLSSLQTALAIKADFVENRVYKDGLSVKEVPIANSKAKFVGADITINANSLFCAAHNRNWQSMHLARQAFPRFHSWSSAVDSSTKVGTLIGSLLRIRRLSSFDASVILDSIKLYLELKCIRYPDHIFVKALRRLSHRTSSVPTSTSAATSKTTKNTATEAFMQPTSTRNVGNHDVWLVLFNVLQTLFMKSSTQTKGTFGGRRADLHV